MGVFRRPPIGGNINISGRLVGAKAPENAVPLTAI